VSTPIYKILHYPHVLLRKKSEPVSTWGKDLAPFIEGMVATMYAHQGIGLAAPQVGILKRILVVDIKAYLENPELSAWHGSSTYLVDGKEQPFEWPLRLVNPEITERHEKVNFPFDGCLSLPGVPPSESERDRRVVLKAKTPGGQTVEIRAEGILSICLQHELDHLEGVLFIDRVTAPADEAVVEDIIHAYEEDPITRRSERKLKPIDARKCSFDFLS
jgi:peptide deformylase